MQLTPDFEPKRNEKCFCESGLRFKQCCGSAAPDRAPPHGIVVVENFLSPEQCSELVATANACENEPLQTVDIALSTPDEVVRTMHEGRVTELVKMGEHQATLNALIKSAITTTMAPALGREFEWFEQPQLLRYSSGSFYHSHADSENYIPELEQWRKDLDRDISMLLYLNDEFEGGKIGFDNFGYKIKPKAGMLIYFPSDNRYLHTAETVTSGLRYAVVSWAALKGVEKVRSAPPENSIPLG